MLVKEVLGLCNEYDVVVLRSEYGDEFAKYDGRDSIDSKFDNWTVVQIRVADEHVGAPAPQKQVLEITITNERKTLTLDRAKDLLANAVSLLIEEQEISTIADAEEKLGITEDELHEIRVLKSYRCEVTVETEGVVYVDALSKEEAEGLAEQEAAENSECYFDEYDATYYVGKVEED